MFELFTQIWTFCWTVEDVKKLVKILVWYNRFVLNISNFGSLWAGILRQISSSYLTREVFHTALLIYMPLISCSFSVFYLCMFISLSTHHSDLPSIRSVVGCTLLIRSRHDFLPSGCSVSVFLGTYKPVGPLDSELKVIRPEQTL